MPSNLPPPTETDINSRKPWPGYFLVRKTGEIVPLIAVDELPSHMQIVGLNRCLELEDTIGMLNLGLKAREGGVYQVVRREGGKKERESPAPKPRPTPTPKVVTTATSLPPQPPPNSPTNTNQNRITPNTRISTQPQTQVCHHWCTHGICKWGQRCRYRHIMPMNLHGLREIGLVDWPTWFRQQNPGFFAGEDGSGRATGGNGRSGGGKDNEIGERVLRRLRRLMEMKRERVGSGKVVDNGKSEKVVKEESKIGKGLDNRILKGKTRRWEDDYSEDSEDSVVDSGVGSETDEDVLMKKNMEVGSGKLVDI